MLPRITSPKTRRRTRAPSRASGFVLLALKRQPSNDDPFHLIEAVLVASAVLKLYVRVVEACFAIVGALLELGARG